MALFTCGITSGCRRSEGNFVDRAYTFADVENCIHVGSTKEDLVSNFGKPSHESIYDNGTVWGYPIYPGLRKKGSGFGGFTVLLRDGKVVELAPILTDY